MCVCVCVCVCVRVCVHMRVCNWEGAENVGIYLKHIDHIGRIFGEYLSGLK